MEYQNKIKKFLAANFRIFALITPLIILFVGYFYILKPKYDYLKETGGLTIKTLQKSLDLKKEYLKNLNELKVTYNNLSDEEKNKLEQILPLKKDLPNLFVHFESLVKQNGFQLGGIDFKEEDFTERIKALSISLGLKGGNYQLLKGFLKNLEEDVKMVDVISVSFTKEGYSLTLKTYYLKE